MLMTVLLSFTFFSCDMFFQIYPQPLLITNCLSLQKKTWKNVVFPLGFIKTALLLNQDETQTRVTDLWERSGHDQGHAPHRHHAGLVRLLLLCTYKALAGADLHYDSCENQQRLLTVQRAVWGHTSRWVPQDRKGWKTFKICGLFRGLCWEGRTFCPLSHGVSLCCAVWLKLLPRN